MSLSPRKARQKSESGIYHIIIQGINHQIIFNKNSVLKIIDDNREKALKDFVKFNNQNTDQKWMDIEEKHASPNKKH